MAVADPSLALQKAIVAVLKNDAAVAAQINGRIYDAVPVNATKPYISLGPFDLLPELGDCLDGAAVSIQLDGWAAGPDTVAIKRLGSAVAAALDEAEFALDNGQRLVECTVERIQYLRDPDGITAHSVITIEAHCEPIDVAGVTLNPLTLSANTIPEGSPENTVVGALQAITPGSTLSLTNTAGGRFKISGTNVVAGATATDFETTPSHNITVRETHPSGINSPRDTVLAITVSDVDEGAAPMMRFNVAANSQLLAVLDEDV